LKFLHDSRSVAVAYTKVWNVHVRSCVIVLSEQHLYRILKLYFAYYHRSRPHLSLGKDPPVPRAVQAPEMGKIAEMPEVGGLHHRDERLAA